MRVRTKKQNKKSVKQLHRLQRRSDALLNIQFICTSLLAIFILARCWSECLFRFGVWYLQGYETAGTGSRARISMCQLVNKEEPETEGRLELLSPFIAFECWLNWRSISCASPELSRCLESMNSLCYGASWSSQSSLKKETRNGRRNDPT